MPENDCHSIISEQHFKDMIRGVIVHVIQENFGQFFFSDMNIERAVSQAGVCSCDTEYFTDSAIRGSDFWNYIFNTLFRLSDIETRHSFSDILPIERVEPIKLISSSLAFLAIKTKLFIVCLSQLPPLERGFLMDDSTFDDAACFLYDRSPLSGGSVREDKLAKFISYNNIRSSGHWYDAVRHIYVNYCHESDGSASLTNYAYGSEAIDEYITASLIDGHVFGYEILRPLMGDQVTLFLAETIRLDESNEIVDAEYFQHENGRTWHHNHSVRSGDLFRCAGCGDEGIFNSNCFVDVLGMAYCSLCNMRSDEYNCSRCNGIFRNFNMTTLLIRRDKRNPDNTRDFFLCPMCYMEIRQERKSTERCIHCGCTKGEQSPALTFEDNTHICKRCFERISTCSDCGQKHLPIDLFSKHTVKKFCSHQFRTALQNRVIGVKMASLYKTNTNNCSSENNSSYCYNCFNRKFVICKHCHKIIRTRRTYNYTGGSPDNYVDLCNDCYQLHYDRCFFCGENHFIDNMNYVRLSNLNTLNRRNNTALEIEINRNKGLVPFCNKCFFDHGIKWTCNGCHDHFIGIMPHSFEIWLDNDPRYDGVKLLLHMERTYCWKCFKKDFIECQDCGELRHKNLVKRITIKNEGIIGRRSICLSCLQEKYVKCHVCNTYFKQFRENGSFIEDYFYCDLCITSDFVHCTRCNKLIHIDRSYRGKSGTYREDFLYCEYCKGNQLTKYIFNYTYKPKPNILLMPNEVYSDKHSRLYGVELEFEYMNTSETKILRCLNIISPDNSLFYLKPDASLNCGVEIVTHPCSLSYHKNKFPWYDIMSWLHYNGCSSNNDTCGVHIHTNRSSISNTSQIRLGIFIHRFSSKLSKLARRTSDRQCKFKNVHDDSLFEIVNNPDRHEAINFINGKTIELRIFKGTLSPTMLCGYIELYDAILGFIKNNSTQYLFRDSQAVWRDFECYILKSRYDFLPKMGVMCGAFNTDNMIEKSNRSTANFYEGGLDVYIDS